ncbi:MAG: hypothetical protein WDM81_11515 [Rhizomicrobium sp.]
MSWANLGTYRGWHIYWNTENHKMYTKTDGIFPNQHDFYERPHDRATAYAVARRWIDERR